MARGEGTVVWHLGERSHKILKVIRDNPKNAYGQGIYDLTDGLYLEQIHSKIHGLAKRGMLEKGRQIQTRPVHGFVGFQTLYVITEKGKEALRRMEEKAVLHKSAVEKEREACAQLVESFIDHNEDGAGQVGLGWVAKKIRERR